MDKLEEETKSAKRLALNIGKLLIALGLRRKTNECAAKEGLKNWKGQPYRQTDHTINNYKQIYRSKRLIKAKFKFGGAIRRQCVTLKYLRVSCFVYCLSRNCKCFFFRRILGGSLTFSRIAK